jgi:hypothetical protein
LPVSSFFNSSREFLPVFWITLAVDRHSFKRGSRVPSLLSPMVALSNS